MVGVVNIEMEEINALSEADIKWLKAFCLPLTMRIPSARPMVFVSFAEADAMFVGQLLRNLRLDGGIEGYLLKSWPYMEVNAADFGITLHGMDSPHRGIVHVIGPELGRTQPGMTIVCGDSHSSTHGALGALAFGIGTTEVAHVLATQCLLAGRPRTFAVTVEGRLPEAVTAKDLILALITRIGPAGATGHVLEYRGPAVRALSMEERMTVCNMSIEAGARAGMIAPDEATFAYLAGRPRAPAGSPAQSARSPARPPRPRSDPGAASVRVSARKRRGTAGPSVRARLRS